MASEFTSDGPIESKQHFENALIKLVRTAQANDVDPTGFYASRQADGHRDVEINILELENAE